MSGKDGKRKIKYSVQFTFFAISFLFVALMIGLLNTYPTTGSRDVVFSTKQSLMLSQVSLMSSSLSALNELDRENVQQVMELMDVNSFDRVIVTDESAQVLYDSAAVDNARGKYALFSELTRALAGEVVFFSKFDGEAFRSRAATPVVSFGEVIGAVYLFEYDGEQAAVIHSVQNRLRTA